MSHKALATTIGVGIQCPPIAFVDHSLQIRDLAELKPQLIALLQKEIKRG